ncbi:MAG: hypothetical protein AB7H19_12235 [Porticoccaceae bacterium]
MAERPPRVGPNGKRLGRKRTKPENPGGLTNAEMRAQAHRRRLAATDGTAYLAHDTYTPELGAKICERVRTRPLYKVVRDSDINISAETAYNWLVKYPQFELDYLAARRIRGLHRVDEFHKIEEKLMEGVIDAPSATVLLKSMIWQAGRENSPVFGDKLYQSIKAEGFVTKTDDELKAQLAQLLASDPKLLASLKPKGD